MDDIIASHRQVGQALRYLTVIAEQAGEGIVVLDFDGIIQFANAAWAAMHGYETTSGMVGKHISEFHTQQQMENDVADFIEETKHRGRLAGPLEHVRTDGTSLPTETLMVVFKDESGKAIGLIGFTTDLTEYKYIQNQLKQYHNHMEKLVRQQTAELTTANEKLQCEINEHRQAEEHLRQQTAELTAANKQLQVQIADYEQTETELKENRDRLEQLLKQQTTELTTAKEKFQREIRDLKQAEEHLRQQTSELTTANEQLQAQVTQHKQTEY
ncbi:MAG: PAS domain-containing protein, partial [Planctomycetota bacterium]